MEWTIVKSQAEFDAAIWDRKTHVELVSAITVDIRLPAGFAPAVKSVAGSLIRIFEGSVVARGSAKVVARESASVVARGSAKVEAWESAKVEAWGSAKVEAWGSAKVEAWESAKVVAWESTSVVARESTSVVARESASVVARESASVVARESAKVEAWGSAKVVAWGSTSVVAWGSAKVEAWGSASVVARAASMLRIFGGLVKATATLQVSVHLHDGAKCQGGVQIPVEQPKTPREWCEWHGAETKGDYAILFKGLGDDFKSPYGASYKPGTETVAEDWDGGTQECDLGLHFSPSPGMTKEFNGKATKFVACLVPLSGIAVHPDGEYPHKVKAQRCWNYYECDSRGQVIGEKHEPPKAEAS